jgi:membrane associated rhomboid family serine protease
MVDLVRRGGLFDRLVDKVKQFVAELELKDTWPVWILIGANVGITAYYHLYRELEGKKADETWVISRRSFAKDKLTAVRSMFVHYDHLHLYYNMLSLRLVGAPLVKMIGPTRFFALYFTAGIAGSIAQCYYPVVAKKVNFPAFDADKSLRLPEFGSAGASGAIYGLCGALYASNPHRMFRIFSVKPVPGTGMLKFEVVKGVFWAWAGKMLDIDGWLGKILNHEGWITRLTQVGHFAHLAGILVGCGWGVLFKDELTRLLYQYDPKSRRLIPIWPAI